MLLLACQILATCAPLPPSGPGLHIDPLPANVAAPCPRPETALDLGDWKVISGWLGTELIKCSSKQAVAVDAYVAVAAAVNSATPK
jgi:hypothetical protein